MSEQRHILERSSNNNMRINNNNHLMLFISTIQKSKWGWFRSKLTQWDPQQFQWLSSSSSSSQPRPAYSWCDLAGKGCAAAQLNWIHNHHVLPFLSVKARSSLGKSLAWLDPACLFLFTTITITHEYYSSLDHLKFCLHYIWIKCALLKGWGWGSIDSKFRLKKNKLSSPHLYPYYSLFQFGSMLAMYKCSVAIITTRII